MAGVVGVDATGVLSILGVGRCCHFMTTMNFICYAGLFFFAGIGGHIVTAMRIMMGWHRLHIVGIMRCMYNMPGVTGLRRATVLALRWRGLVMLVVFHLSSFQFC